MNMNLSLSYDIRLSASPTKWSNTLKQFVGKLPTTCLSVFDHFVGLTLKGLTICSYECNPVPWAVLLLVRISWKHYHNMVSLAHISRLTSQNLNTDNVHDKSRSVDQSCHPSDRCSKNLGQNEKSESFFAIKESILCQCFISIIPEKVTKPLVSGGIKMKNWAYIG